MPNVNALIEKLYNENQKSQKVRLEAANMLKPDDATYNQNVLKQKDLDMIKLFIKYSSCLNINKLSDDLVKFHIDFLPTFLSRKK